MTHTQPCAKPENNPDDWYLRPDGRQYSDEEIILNAASFIADAHANGDDRPDEEILEEGEAEAVREAVKRRRHAKDKCYTECYFRLQCLDLALRNNETFGTWGGYYQEELAEIRKVRRQRGREGRLLN